MYFEAFVSYWMFDPDQIKKSGFLELECSDHLETFGIDRTREHRMWVQYEVDLATLSGSTSPEIPKSGFQIWDPKGTLSVTSLQITPPNCFR